MSKLALIGGGTGFIGKAVSSLLQRKGYNTINISRSAGAGRITWADVEQKGLPPHVDAVVQLSGENIMDKNWTPERKSVLLDSRIKPTQILVNAIAKAANPPSVFVCGSAIGIYPSDPKLSFDEYSKFDVANNFAGEICEKWETASTLPPSVADKVRRVTIRTGVVLGEEGAMQQMAPPFKFGVGGPIGSGKQWFPWISLDDISGLFVYAVENPEVRGVLNGVAPGIVTNEEFSKSMGSVLYRPALLRAPEFAMNFVFGERAFLVLEGSRIAPSRALELGYTFVHPDLEPALKHIFHKE